MSAVPNAPYDSGLPPAGVMSRVGKFAVGALQLSFVYAVATHLATILRVVPPAGGFWVFVAWAFWLVAPVVNLGAIRERSIGSRTRWWVFAALALVAVVGRTVSGTWWSLPTAGFVVGVAIVVHGYVGISHLASAVLGFPGCELRALAYVVGRTRGGTSTFAPCPGAWTPLDRWEARLRHRA